MSVWAFLALALPAAGLLLSVCLCIAAARGDDILRDHAEELSAPGPLIDFETGHVVDVDEWARTVSDERQPA